MDREYEDVQIQMTEEEFAKLTQMAKDVGMDINEYVNDLLKKSLEDGTFEKIAMEYKDAHPEICNYSTEVETCG